MNRQELEETILEATLQSIPLSQLVLIKENVDLFHELWNKKVKVTYGPKGIDYSTNVALVWGSIIKELQNAQDHSSIQQS